VVIIENDFDVAATPDEVYKLMLDPERVGTCITGAQVTGRREDGSYDANVTVKLGPVKMTYRGTIAIVESDAAARTATMLAKGAEERGQGTAQATLTMAVTERDAGGSHVNVSADMLVTGRVAQMGRGVMQDVARRMIGQMAQNMEALLAGGAPPAATGDAVSAGSMLGSVVADRAKRIFGSQGE
jgi:carbon monoxide dehydrogenase subunit G